MKSNSFRKSGLAALAVAANMLFAGHMAVAAPTFKVDESVAGGAANIVTADRLTFGYQAKIIQTTVGPLDGVGDTFVENGFLNKASYELGAGNAVGSQLNGFGVGGYKIYGVFKITGTATTNAGGDGIDATFKTATLQLILDKGQDTVLGFDGSNNVTVADGGAEGADVVLANLSLIVGEAHVFGGLAKGDFNSFLDFSLTPFGKTFFVSPNPFFDIENFGGNTQTLIGASLTQSFVADASGAGVELFQFQTPEPGTVSLVGLALLGIGGITRRAQKKHSQQ
jgi:hypothetical protein